jgi:hypothetical protein
MERMTKLATPNVRVVVARALLLAASVAAPAVAVPGTAASQVQRAFPPLESVLQIDRPRLTIGDEDRSGPALFGAIVDVAVDRAGNAYVLDGTDHSIRAFSPAGRHLGSVGRPGQGPGDLRNPAGLWHDGTSTLYVIDRNAGVSVFDARNGAMAYRDRFGSELKPSAICTLGGELIVGGLRNDRLVHVLAPDHNVKRSFGELFRRDTHPEIQATYNRENLVMACDTERGRIFVAEGHHDIARAYDINGRLLWQTILPEYSGYSVRLDTKRPNAVGKFWGEFATRTILPVGADLLVIQARHQTARRDPARGGGLRYDDHGIVTYILSSNTGAILTRQRTAPFFLAASGPNEVIAYRDEPFPQVFFVRATAGR